MVDFPTVSVEPTKYLPGMIDYYLPGRLNAVTIVMPAEEYDERVSSYHTLLLYY